MPGQWASFGKGVKVIQWKKDSLFTNSSGTPRNLENEPRDMYLEYIKKSFNSLTKRQLKNEQSI